MNELQELLVKLDMALTGKTLKQAQHTSRNSAIKDVDGWLFGSGHDRCYYLSDGGYSRVTCEAIIDDPPRIYLTSNSLQRVKDRWEDVKGLRAQIEQLLEDYIQDLLDKEKQG